MYFNPLALLAFLASAILLGLNVAVRSHTDRRGVPIFRLLMASSALYTFAYGLELSSTTEPMMRAFYALQYVGIGGMYVLFWPFAATYTGSPEQLKPIRILLLSLVSVSTLVALITNPWHGQFHKDIGVLSDDLYPRLVFTPGVWYYAFHLFGFVNMGVCLYELARFAGLTPQAHRKQVYILLTGSALPFVAFGLYLLDVFPPGVDPTPFSFLFTGLFFFAGLSRYDLFDVSPTARSVLFEQMPDGVLFFDKWYRITDFNQALSRIFPLSAADVGGNVTEVFGRWPGLGAFVEHQIKLGAGATRMLIGQRHYEVWLYPLQNDRAAFLGGILVFRDETDRFSAEMSLYVRNEELRKVNLEKDTLLSLVAHDLRSPFMSLMGLTEIMANPNENLSVEDMREYSAMVHDSARSTYVLISNLLEWSRLQRQLHEFQPVPLSLNALTYEVWDLLRERARQKEIRFTYEVPANINVLGDAHMMGSVLRNLAGNAIKFTAKGGSVHIRAEETLYGVRIVIQDTGIGMPPEMVLKIFEMGAVRGRVGTDGESSSGMGLVLTKGFVEAQGGSLSVSSEVGVGSTFTVTFPRVTNA